MKGYVARILWYLAVIEIVLIPSVKAQDVSPLYQTYPFIESFSRKDYNASTQNWDILQDARGVMYFGNGQGVLEFNGDDWRLIRLTNNSTARSMALSEDSTIFVGGIDEIGYLTPDSLGQLKYKSLLPFIPEGDRNFGEVWFTHALPDGIYFQTLTHLFRWHEQKITVWQAPSRFNTSASVHDTLWVHSLGDGLQRMRGDSLVTLNESAHLAEEWVFVMLPFDEETILVGTRDQGFYLLKGNVFEPFPTEVDEYLLTKTLYLPGAILKDGSIALNTRDAGLLILDRKGRLLHHIDEQKGFSTDQTYYIYQDTEQGLWVALGNGIARVKYPSPISFLNQVAGLPEEPMALEVYDGNVYAGSRGGVHRVDSKGNMLYIAGAERKVWDLVAASDALFAAVVGGVFHIQGETASYWDIGNEAGTNFYTAFSLHQSRLDPGILFVGKRNGLDVISYTGPNSWSLLGSIPDIQNQVNSINEQTPGKLELGMDNGVIHLTYSSSTLLTPDLHYLGEDEGLPIGSVKGHYAAGTQFYAAIDGLYTYNDRANYFERQDTLFPDISFEDFVAYGSINDGLNGDVWLTSKDGVYQVSPDVGGGYLVQSAPFLEASNWTIIESIVDSTGVVWFGGVDGLVRYDPSIYKSYTTTASPLITRIIVAEDSVIAGGSGAPFMDHYPQSLELNHRENSIRFDFQAPQYDLTERMSYQTTLEGYNSSWSSFSPDASREYTNLPGGTYVFRVRARNAYGAVSEEGNFSFKVHPPWWFKWWAYALYGVLLVGVFFTVDRFQRRRLIVRERLRAEREKAKAIESTNQELERALKHLTETQDQLIHTEKMASLGQLTAGVAHEIKNPLNFINNFAEICVGQAEDLEELLEKYRGNLETTDAHEIKSLLDDLKLNASKINKYGHRADGIIRSMLDHSRAEPGQKRPTDINKLLDEFLNLAYHGVKTRIDGNEVTIHRQYNESLPEIYVVAQEIGRVFINILDNAFYAVNEKAASENGQFEPQVTVVTEKKDDEVEIRIEDNGTGVSSDIKDKIFEPFFTTKPTGSGTGLGLSLSYDIITKGHSGTVTVKSERGKGATFIIALPINDEPV